MTQQIKCMSEAYGGPRCVGGCIEPKDCSGLPPTMFTDLEIMNRTVDGIDKHHHMAVRVSAEHYLWLAGQIGVLRAVVATAGGVVDGGPTSTINILQRIRALRKLEALDASAGAGEL